jgi:hypothetical protein
MRTPGRRSLNERAQAVKPSSRCSRRLLVAGRVVIRRAVGHLEVGVGDMACIPKGSETTWHLTTPFLDFYVLG